MTDRFERLFQLEENLYVNGSPIIVAVGSLLKDSRSGSIIAQLKFQSVSEKTIKAVKVSLAAFDVSGAQLKGVSDYQYLELSVENGQFFGSKKAIVMPMDVTRSFAVESVVVVFKDGSMWESSGPFSAMPNQKKLSLFFKNDELEKQYCLATSASAKYCPFEERGLWTCSCGTWNSGRNCTQCKVSKDVNFASLDIDALTQQMNIRLAKEKMQQEEEAAKKAQIEAEAQARRAMRKKRAKKLTIIAIVVILVIGAAVAIYKKAQDRPIEKLLALKTRSDVVAWLGEPAKAWEEGFYNVVFMGQKYNMTLEYNGETLDNWTLKYSYPGVNDSEKAGTIEDYKPSEKEQRTADRIVSKVTATFAEKYGNPEIFDSDRSGTVYTWVVNDRMIKLLDYTDSEKSRGIGAIEIQVNCDHQSFCKHADFKVEEADETCTENGYTRKTCTVCGYVDETVHTAVGHKYTSVVKKEATCSENGEKVSSCSVCGNEETAQIEKLPHTYEESVIEKPTCTKEGVQKNTCVVCGDSYEKSVSMVAHSYAFSVTKAATCTDTGTKVNKCTECDKIEATTTISALGHDYGQYSIEEATCTTNGIRHMKCTRCGNTKKETIAAYGHSWKNATCTNPKQCRNCGITTGTALGHDWWDPIYDSIYCLNGCGESYKTNIKYNIGRMPPTYTYSSYGNKYYTNYTILSLDVVSETADSLNNDNTANVYVDLEIAYAFEGGEGAFGCSGKITAYNSVGETDWPLWNDEFYLHPDLDTYRNGLYYCKVSLWRLRDNDTYNISIELKN